MRNRDCKETRWGRTFLLMGLAAGILGCGEASPQESIEVVESPVKGGTFTTARPEALLWMSYMANGNVHGCTGTLIGPSEVLTAAHCIAEEASVGGTFNTNLGFTVKDFELIAPSSAAIAIHNSNSCSSDANCAAGTYCDGTMGRCYTWGGVDRAFPQGVHIGADDLAIGHLTAPIPSSVATPAQIATIQPSNTNLTLVGYGCLSDSQGDFGFKRFKTYFFNGASTQNYCDGDSGGPTFLGSLNANGAIVRVTSGHVGVANNDNGADPVAYRNQVLAMVSAMETTSGLSFRAQMQTHGFLGAVTSGGTAGLPGQGLRLEGLQIWSQTANVVPVYRAYVQDIGWQAEVSDGKIAGTVGQAKRMEAVQIRLASAGRFSNVRYRANVAGTWQPFINGGQTCSNNAACATNLCANGMCAAGTVGQSKRLDAVQIQIF